MNSEIKKMYENKKSIYAGGNADILLRQVYSVKEALDTVASFVRDKNLKNRELRLVFRHIDEDGDDIVLTNVFISKYYDDFPYPTKFTDNVDIVGSSLFVINPDRDRAIINGMSEDEFTFMRIPYLKELKDTELKERIRLCKEGSVEITDGMVRALAITMVKEKESKTHTKFPINRYNKEVAYAKEHIYSNIESYKPKLIERSITFNHIIRQYKLSVIKKIGWDPFTSWNKQYYGNKKKGPDQNSDGIISCKLGSEKFFNEMWYIANRIYYSFLSENRKEVVLKKFKDDKREIVLNVFTQYYFERHNIHNGFLKNNYIVKEECTGKKNSSKKSSEDNDYDSYTNPSYWDEFNK